MQYYEQTRNLIARAREFQAHLTNCYPYIADTAKQEEIKRLLAYLTYHGQELDYTLAQLGSDTANKVLDIWFKYIPEGSTCKCFDIIHVYPQIPMDEAVDVVMEIDSCLLELYEEISKSWDAKQVQEIFGNLVSKSRVEKRKISRESSMLQY